MKTNNIKWVYLFTLSIIWGSSFILIKKSLLGLTPMQLGVLRNLITSLILLSLGFRGLKSVRINEWKWLAVSGLVGSFVPAFLFAIAETEIDSAVTSVLNSLVPMHTFWLGLTLFNIPSSKRQFLGLIIAFVGSCILMLNGAEINPNQNYWYAGFILLSGIMYGLNVNIIKRYLYDIKPLTIAAGNYFVIFFPAVVMLFFVDFFSHETFNNPEFGMALVYVTTLSFFGTAMAKILFNKLVKISAPVFASSVTYVMPIVALMWGFLDGEKFSFTQGVASFIILLGVFLVHRRR
ncbi:DMT family transporter [Aestuariibaculum sediminum]|uniref:EamA family transporter n=1 Tax=Aestuariibaculum sediminum TaxID=2770637 RepID=A0A8J6Q6Q2_9FLAO|nr:EamA family transporter [Aestuariibaculum sediminum]MBD0830990.1 EamA family transporter [Aestuariibaculum sediminum]